MKLDWAGDFEAWNYGVQRRADRRHIADLLGIVGMLLLVAGVLVIRSWEQGRIVSIGYEAQRLQKVEEQLERDEKSLILEEAALKDPERIDQWARFLGMEPVRPNQVLAPRYPEPERAGALGLTAALQSPAGADPNAGDLAMAARPADPVGAKKLGATN